MQCFIIKSFEYCKSFSLEYSISNLLIFLFTQEESSSITVKSYAHDLELYSRNLALKHDNLSSKSDSGCTYSFFCSISYFKHLEETEENIRVQASSSQAT